MIVLALALPLLMMAALFALDAFENWLFPPRSLPGTHPLRTPRKTSHPDDGYRAATSRWLCRIRRRLADPRAFLRPATGSQDCPSGTRPGPPAPSPPGSPRSLRLHRHPQTPRTTTSAFETWLWS